MSKLFLRTSFICLSAMTLPLIAGQQDKQKLQYIYSREPRTIAIDISMPYIESCKEVPDSNRLPELNEDPLIYKWITPLAKDGYLYIALDRAGRRSERDLLYIDSNSDGRLSDESAVRAYRVTRQHPYFGPVEIKFETLAGPVVYHLNFRLCDHGNKLLRISSAGWYEGPITIDQDEKYCVLIDHNANGTFDDKSLDPGKADRIRIGEKNNRDTLVFGDYVTVGGLLYQPEVTDSGTYIKFTKAQNVKYGKVRMPEIISEFSACGQNGLYEFIPENGIGSLPVGQYCINSWILERKDNSGARWKLQAGLVPKEGVFEVSENTVTELKIGEPISSTVMAQKRGNGYSLNLKFMGRLGEPIKLTRNGSRPPVPKLRIKSEDGQYNRIFSFKYG